jgi:hypothetical protein
MIEQLPLPQFKVERKFFPWTENLLGKENGEVYTALLHCLTFSATRVLLHEYKPDRFIPVGIQDAIGAQGRLEQLVCLAEGHTLGFTSAVETKTGQIEHLLLLDYNCVKTPENLLKITIGLDQLGELNHVIFETDNSFHSIRIGPDRTGGELLPLGAILVLMMSLLDSMVLDF